MILELVYAFFASLGSGALFNIKGKNLFFAALGGGITWLLYSIPLKFGVTNLLSLFIASIGAGLYSEIFARVLKNPVTTFLISAIICLVPGGGMYYTMFDSIQGNVSKSLITGLNTLSSAGAIAVGILVASSITKFILASKKYFWYNLSNRK